MLFVLTSTPGTSVILFLGPVGNCPKRRFGNSSRMRCRLVADEEASADMLIVIVDKLPNGAENNATEKTEYVSNREKSLVQ